MRGVVVVMIIEGGVLWEGRMVGGKEGGRGREGGGERREGWREGWREGGRGWREEGGMEGGREHIKGGSTNPNVYDRQLKELRPHVLPNAIRIHTKETNPGSGWNRGLEGERNGESAMTDKPIHDTNLTLTQTLH